MSRSPGRGSATSLARSSNVAVSAWMRPAGPPTPERAGRCNERCACPPIAVRDGPPYFLVVGFLAVDEGWQHEPPAGLAELVLGLVAVIAGLLPVIAGLGVPFHGSIAFS